jgi:hypothetical protein
MIVMQNNDALTRRSTVLIFIEPDNLARMEKADPITLMPQTAGGVLAGVAFPYSLRVVIAYEPEPERLYDMMKAGLGFENFLNYAERGYEFKATDGLRAGREGGNA